MNIIHQQARITELAIHHAGNPALEDETVVYDHLVSVDASLEKVLLRYIFQMVQSPEIYQLNRDMGSHETHEIVDSLLAGESGFIDATQRLTQFLSRHSNHPKIKSGELLVARIDQVMIDDEMVSAMAMIKMESQRDFMQIDHRRGSTSLQLLYGFDPRTIDKGCVVLGTEKEDGYMVYAQDKSSRGTEAKFWMQDFLGIQRRSDTYYRTEGIIDATRQFVHSHLKPTYDMDKTDEAHIMDRSRRYLESRHQYDADTYAADVFETTEIAEQFQEYRDDYEQEMEVPVKEAFAIHPAAVKRSAKYFRSVIKLDRNFHVYVHGDRNQIQKGTDETGRKFYKLYFDQES